MRYWYFRRHGCISCLRHTRSAKKLVCILVLISVGVLTYSKISLIFLPSSSQYTVICSSYENCPNIRVFGGGTSASGPTKFPLIVPHIEPYISCEDRKLFLAVVVNSAADEEHRVRRMAIRKTWGISAKTRPTLKWRLFFALGLSENAAVNIQDRRESLKYNDVLLGNFTDNYKNVVIKTFMSHYWVYFRLNCQYILKADDDVYIRVAKLAEWLVGPANLPTRFYGGYLLGQESLTVVRDPKIKWFLPKEVYNETNFPPFSHGSFQVVSTDMLPKFFHYTQFVRKPFHTDDAYFGVMAKDFGLTARQIPGFRFSLPKKDKELRDTIAFGHQVDAAGMLNYHARYELLD